MWLRLIQKNTTIEYMAELCRRMMCYMLETVDVRELENKTMDFFKHLELNREEILRQELKYLSAPQP